MNLNVLIFVVVSLIVVFFIVFFFIKSVAKAVFAAIVITVAFRVFWIYSSEDIINLFRLDQIMTEERVGSFKIFYDDFKNRREEDPIIIPERIEDGVKEELEGKIEEYFNEINSDN